MKIGQDVWALYDPDTKEILRLQGVLLVYETEKMASDTAKILPKHMECMIQRIRLLPVRVGRIDESEIDGS